MNGAQLVYESDTEIIRDYCSTGSNRAANAFVRKYQKFVYSIALRYLKNHHDAEDAAQEVFIKALRNLKSYRSDASPATWLYRITANICSNMKRKKKFLSFFGDSGTADFFNLSSNGLTPEQKMESSEFEDSFMEALGGLPVKQRETFALRYFDGLTYNEISEILGTSVGGLKANYYQAVKKLSAALKDA